MSSRGAGRLIEGVEVSSQARAEYKNLPIPVMGQEKSFWCWATSLQMILSHWKAWVPQREIVSACYPDEDNRGGWPEFEDWGFSAKRSDGALSWKRLKKEIDKDRPVAFSWRWNELGAGHMMVATGYLFVPPEGKWVVVHNPWPPHNGDSELITYQRFLTGPFRHWCDYWRIKPRDGRRCRVERRFHKKDRKRLEVLVGTARPSGSEKQVARTLIALKVKARKPLTRAETKAAFDLLLAELQKGSLPHSEQDAWLTVLRELEKKEGLSLSAPETERLAEVLQRKQADSVEGLLPEEKSVLARLLMSADEEISSEEEAHAVVKGMRGLWEHLSEVADQRPLESVRRPIEESDQRRLSQILAGALGKKRSLPPEAEGELFELLVKQGKSESSARFIVSVVKPDLAAGDEEQALSYIRDAQLPQQFASALFRMKRETVAAWPIVRQALHVVNELGVSGGLGSVGLEGLSEETLQGLRELESADQEAIDWFNPFGDLLAAERPVFVARLCLHDLRLSFSLLRSKVDALLADPREMIVPIHIGRAGRWYGRSQSEATSSITLVKKETLCKQCGEVLPEEGNGWRLINIGRPKLSSALDRARKETLGATSEWNTSFFAVEIPEIYQFLLIPLNTGETLEQQRFVIPIYDDETFGFEGCRRIPLEEAREKLRAGLDKLDGQPSGLEA